MSTPAADRRLLRYLHGELPPAEARRLRAQLDADPALAARLARLQALWEGVEGPAPSAPPGGAAARLARAAWQRESAGAGGWLRLGPAPSWARPLAGAALAAGVALGLWIGRPLPPVIVEAVAAADAEAGERAREGDAPGLREGASSGAGAMAAGAEGSAGAAEESRVAVGAPLPAGASATTEDPTSTEEPAADLLAAYEGATTFGDSGALGGGTLAEAFLSALEGDEGVEAEL